MTPILVVGGAGYIGSHTCKYLAENGYHPIVFDNFSEGHRDFVRWGPVVEGDIGDRAALDAAIAEHKPAAIIHFAALIEVGESVKDPERFYHNNVSGLLTLAGAAKDAGNIPVIFSSTCATYGVPQAAVLTEDHPQNPISPYGRTKLMAERILQDFDMAYGLRSVSLRYFNACGAADDGSIGEAHKIESHLIPRAILARLGHIDDFAIFGDDYDTPDGSCVRDYIHVTDLAQAHLKAAEYLMNGGKTDQFNIGSGNGFSVFEIIKAVEKVSGGKVPLTMGPRRAGDPPLLVGSNEKAREVLGFDPKFSDVEYVVESAWNWHRTRNT